MKKVLFTVLVILLTPIYFIIKIFIKIIEMLIEITNPIAEAMYMLVNEMEEFWENIFKRERRGTDEQYTKKN